MLNEVLRLTQGDLTNVIKDDKEKDETERNEHINTNTVLKKSL